MKKPSEQILAKAYEIGVMKLLKEVAESGDDVHENHTPSEICDMMLDKVDLALAKSILVLYNIELLFALRKAKYQGHVTFFTQSHKKAELAPKIFGGVNVEYIDKEDNPLYYMENKWPDKFDIVVANPPYSNKLDLKFLDKSFDIAKDEVIFVHPSTAFIERKGVTKIYSSLVNKVKDSLSSITLFNGNGIFEIGLYVPVSITHIKKSLKGGLVQVSNLITGKTSHIEKSKICDISYFGYDERFLKIDEKIKVKKTLGTEVTKNKGEGNFIVQMSKIMGNSWQGDKIRGLEKTSQITQPNFFCIVRKATIVELPVDVRFDNVWYFRSESEAKNFITYCKTDFARMCLALIKVNQNLGPGELSRIPWMDFTQEWTDEKLYAYFNINKEEQAFIKEVIPSYYD